MIDRFPPVMDLFSHGIEKAASFLFADIADQGGLADDVLTLLVGVFGKGRILGHDEIQDGMVQVNDLGIVQDRAKRIVSEDEFVHE
jgi:hypothetical protein